MRLLVRGIWIGRQQLGVQSVKTVPSVCFRVYYDGNLLGINIGEWVLKRLSCRALFPEVWAGSFGEESTDIFPNKLFRWDFHGCGLLNHFAKTWELLSSCPYLCVLCALSRLLQRHVIFSPRDHDRHRIKHWHFPLLMGKHSGPMCASFYRVTLFKGSRPSMLPFLNVKVK